MAFSKYDKKENTVDITTETRKLFGAICTLRKFNSQIVSGTFTSEQIIIDQLLESGGFGKVFKARIVSTGSEVAIKKLDIRYAEEAYFSARLHKFVQNIYGYHPHIVSTFGVVNSSPTNELWVVMSLAHSSLRPYCIGDKHLSATEKFDVNLRCWSGLAFLHRLKLVHRDIAPENILIQQTGSLLMVQLTDFTLSSRKEALLKKDAQARAGDLKGSGTRPRFSGRISYHPPEYYSLGGSQYDYEKADIYAMGVTLCELYTNADFWHYEDRSPLQNQQICFKLQRIDEYVSGEDRRLNILNYKPAALNLLDTCGCDSDQGNALNKSISFALHMQNRPTAEEMVEKMQSTKYFTSLRFHKNYRQCRDIIDEETKIRNAAFAKQRLNNPTGGNWVSDKITVCNGKSLDDFADTVYDIHHALSSEKFWNSTKMFELNIAGNSFATARDDDSLQLWTKGDGIQCCGTNSISDAGSPVLLKFNDSSTFLLAVCSKIIKEDLENKDLLYTSIVYEIKGGIFEMKTQFALAGHFKHGGWYDDDTILFITQKTYPMISDVYAYLISDQTVNSPSAPTFLCKMFTDTTLEATTEDVLSSRQNLCLFSSYISKCSRDAFTAVENAKSKNLFYCEKLPMAQPVCQLPGKSRRNVSGALLFSKAPVMQADSHEAKCATMHNIALQKGTFKGDCCLEICTISIEVMRGYMEDKWFIFTMCDKYTFSQKLGFVLLDSDSMSQLLGVNRFQPDTITGIVGNTLNSIWDWFNYEGTKFLIQDHVLEMPGKITSLSQSDDQRYLIAAISVFPENINDVIFEEALNTKVYGDTEFLIIDMENLQIAARLPCPKLGAAYQLLRNDLDFGAFEAMALGVGDQLAEVLEANQISRATGITEIEVLVAVEKNMGALAPLLGALKGLHDFYQTNASSVLMYAAVNMMVECMKVHSEKAEIQQACILVLRNVVSKVRESLSENEVLQIADLLLNAMHNHYQIEELVSEALSSILLLTLVDHFEILIRACAVLLPNLESLRGIQATEEAMQFLWSVAIYTNYEQKLVLGNMNAVEKVLNVVRKYEPSAGENLLELCYGFLSSIIENVPVNCERFVGNGGIRLFAEFYQKCALSEKCVEDWTSLLANVAKVEATHSYFMDSQAVELFFALLLDETKSFQIRYNSAGILAHAVSGGTSSDTNPGSQAIIDIVIEIMAAWPPEVSLKVDKNVVKPLLERASLHNKPAVQYFSMWTLAHLIGTDSDLCCKLLLVEDGQGVIEAVERHAGGREEIRNLGKDILVKIHAWKTAGSV